MLKTTHAMTLGTLLLSTSLAAFAECPATSVPVIVAEDGEVVATFHQSNQNATFSDDLYLDSPASIYSTSRIFNNKTAQVGSKVILGTFTKGTELRFRLHTSDPDGKIADHDYYTGETVPNPDGKPHARVSFLPSGETLVEFEDFPRNNPKLDECPDGPGAFTDLSFSFTNVKFEQPVQLPPDRFLSYKVKPAPAAATPLTLTDALGNGGPFNAKAKKTASLANPAKVPTGTIHSPEISLAGYALTNTPKRKSTLNVSNELGNWRLATLKAERLLLPTSVVLGGSATTPVLDNQGIVDALACYKTRLISGKKKLKLEQKLLDKLNGAERVYKLAQPTRLCAPADLGAGVKHQETFLMCYALKPATGKPKKVAGISINNERFGASQIKVIKEEEYCVPSTVSK